VAGDEIPLEFARARVPPAAHGVLAAVLWIESQGAPCRPSQIVIQRSRHAVLDDVYRTIDREGRDGHPAGHGFEVHQSKRVREARKDHDIGSRQVRGEILGKSKPRERRSRIQALQPPAFRAVADHQFAAVPRHAQERLDVLLHRDTAHVGCDRSGQIQEVFGSRLEEIRIHAAPPGGQILEAALLQFVAQRLRAHHATHRSAVEPVQGPIGECDRNRKARPQVLRELGMVGGGESQPAPQAVAPRREAERPFGRDVQRLRGERFDALFQAFPRQQRQADLRISRARDAAKVPGRQHPDLVAEAAEPFGGLRQGAHDAVGLRKPGVGNDHDSHEHRQWHGCMTNT